MDQSVEAKLQALADGLDRGLFYDNLEPLIELAKAIAPRTSGPVQVAVYIVESVLVDLQSAWDDGPVSSDAYRVVNLVLGPKIKKVVRAAMDPHQREVLARLQETLVAGLVGLQREQTLR